MKMHCPECGTAGVGDMVAKGTVPVKLCTECNTVFDGIGNGKPTTNFRSRRDDDEQALLPELGLERLGECYVTLAETKPQ